MIVWGDLHVGAIIHLEDPELVPSSWLLVKRTKKNKLGYATFTWLHLDDGVIVPCRNLVTGSIADYRVES